MCDCRRCCYRLSPLFIKRRFDDNSGWLEIYLGIKIKDIPFIYRPREKAIYHGVHSLNEYELLAILIGSGIKGNSAIDIAIELLKEYFSLKNLSSIDYQELIKFKGLSRATSLKLVVAFELAKRILKEENCPKYHSSLDIAKHYQYLNSEKHETLILLILNKRNIITKEKILAVGTQDAVLISPHKIIKEVLLAEEKRFIIIHNHLDDALPSEDDLLFTTSIKNEARKFQLKMVDHIIISPLSYYSFLENNKFNNHQ